MVDMMHSSRDTGVLHPKTATVQPISMAAAAAEEGEEEEEGPLRLPRLPI